MTEVVGVILEDSNYDIIVGIDLIVDWGMLHAPKMDCNEVSNILTEFKVPDVGRMLPDPSNGIKKHEGMCKKIHK